MEDRLVWLLKQFDLKAKVFHTGELCHSQTFSGDKDCGYIHILKKGELRVTSKNRQEIVIREPSVLFYMQPEEHTFYPMQEKPELTCATFDFGLEFGNPLADAMRNPIALKLQQTPSLEKVVELIQLESEETHCGKQAVLDKLAVVVIIQLLRNLLDENQLEIGLFAGLSDKRLACAINAIHRDTSKEWTLSELAHEASMSRARFAERFKSIVGTTPLAYLASWRMSVAQSLLSKGKTIQLVTEMVGYSNSSAFSRAFSKKIGMSPKEWQKRRGTDSE